MSIYDSIQGNHPPKNKFDLSHTHFLTAKVGKLYPVLCKEVLPGDVFKISDAIHAELQPMVAPLLSDLNCYCHTFFVPYRLLYGIDTDTGENLWERFITGGSDGDYDTPLPSWKPGFNVEGFSSDTIWDNIGNPVKLSIEPGHDDVPTKYKWTPLLPKDLDVSSAPKLAYNLIWNDFYRDENLQEEVDLNENEFLLFRDWKKDYFTSALESQQFGTAPALPVNIVYPRLSGGEELGYFKVFNKDTPSGVSNFGNPFIGDKPLFPSVTEQLGSPRIDGWEPSSNIPESSFYYVNSSKKEGGSTPIINANSLGNMVVRVSDKTSETLFGEDGLHATTFNVSDMRLVFAIQRLQELSMRGGHRYTEYLKAHYGVSPTDARLDRPEYIGGCCFAVNVGVSVQTSETAATPQGNKVGVGNMNDVMSVGSYRVEEYGLIMTLLSIVPKPCYSQGISREWLRQTRFNYYHPEFANISEQGVYRAELYVDSTDSANPDNGIFGYQGAWNELRASQNFVSGAMREQFSYWLMQRKFNSRPALNSDFVSLGHPEEYNRIWSVQDEDQFIIAFSNIIEAYRPIPAYSVPGLIDHVYGNV